MLERLFNIKKKFFNRELKQTQAKIWSIEFSRYTTMFEREKTRLEYDNTVQALHMEDAKPEKDKERIEKLTLKRDALKSALDELDVMINGCDPNGKYPEGIQGINQTLEAHIQKREHILNFIKHYC